MSLPLRRVLAIFSLLLVSSISASAADRDFSVFNLGKAKALNPDISVNFLGLLQRGTGISNDRTNPNHNGISLQELELHFTTDVDPYFRAVALIAAEQEDGSTEFGIDPEEVFLETLSLPRVTVKAGKFYAAFGKHNTLHRHAFPFIDAPLVHQQILGEEALNNAGVSGSYLVPTNWYSEIIVQALSSGNEVLYGSPRSGDVAGLVRLKNLWDLNDDLTMEFGISGTRGKNVLDATSSAFGGDLTFKWRPARGGKYRSLAWSTEYLQGHDFISDPAGAAIAIPKLGGIASWIQYQFAERWWAQARIEAVGLPKSDLLPTQKKQSVLLAFLPSEFSGIRLQYDRLPNGPRGKDDHTVALQYNVSIGAHPAHTY